MRKLIFILALSLAVSACSSGSGSGGSSAAQDCGHKNLFSLWHTVQGNIPFDFSSGQFSQIDTFTLLYPNGTCQANYVILGSQCSGSIVISNPQTTSGTVDCSGIAGTLNYTKSYTSGLMLCDAQDASDCTQLY